MTTSSMQVGDDAESRGDSTQTALGVSTTDSETQYRAVLEYIEALRQVPEQSGFPDTVTWPTLTA